MSSPLNPTIKAERERERVTERERGVGEDVQLWGTALFVYSRSTETVSKGLLVYLHPPGVPTLGY